jgi:superfamily II DNA or RNA helicase
MNMLLQPGKLVTLRGRDWVVLPSDDPDLLVVRPLGGSDDETTGIYLPLAIPHDVPKDARFAPPSVADLGTFATTRLLYDAARLAFRNGAGPFRALARLSFRPRSYQLVPLIMALRQEVVRLLVADDVGIGKTVEALLVMRELLERRRIRRFAVICLPHLCDQWQREIREKLDIEAVVIRSSTQARLDRQIQGDVSVYDYYPYQIISIDYVKSDVRRDVFVEQAPELVIVDEAHTCARPAGASASQQQRYHLLSRLAAKPEQHLVLLTATPHSGKPEEFQSLLGLLRSDYEQLDLPKATPAQRRELARHFVQRKRADVARWLGEETPFPTRETFEAGYTLAPDYATLFADILDFARRLVASDPKAPQQRKRVHYWTALALLRGVVSSPPAGVHMLTTRLDTLAAADGDGAGTAWPADADEAPAANPVADGEDLATADTAPTHLIEHGDWTAHQRRQLREFARRLQALAGVQYDTKLANLLMLLEAWLGAGFNPVIFCRYIATATYLGEQLKPLLAKRFPRLDLQVVTSEDPDELRKERIRAMEGAKQRVLVATDCLSEGINLQHLFTGVLHYDLPWNPNRLEQREGRVDRFGQLAKTVRACLLYGVDNPIDGIVLDVLLRKVREIKKATGINVPFPEDSQSIIDTITQALLLNPDRPISARQRAAQLPLAFEEPAADVTRKLEAAAAREQASRSIFAQHAIQASEIEQDLKAVDEAIGDPHAVEAFVVGVLQDLFGVQLIRERTEPGYTIVTGNLPPQLQPLLPPGPQLQVAFVSPPPQGFHYIGRNHRFVEQLCQIVMANTLARQDRRAARAAVIRTREVTRKTTLLLFRCRNVIEQARTPREGRQRIIAEEMLLWGWRGTADDREFLDHATARQLLQSAHASSELSPQSRANFLTQELATLAGLDAEFNRIAEAQSQQLVAAHERFSALLDKHRFQVVYPVLPMDLLGIAMLLPEVAQ